MNHHELRPAAEVIRKEIKELIPETASLPDQPIENKATILYEDKNGNKTYGGTLLAGKIFSLSENMQIGEGWGWRLLYFSEPTKVENKRKRGYLIPLSRDITITPGGVLQEGFYTDITTEPVLSSGATAIFIVPLT